MTKAPTPAEMSKGQSDNTNNATTNSITQRLRTDLGRSFRVTTNTQLLLLTGLLAQPSHFPQQPCNQKDTHIKFVNKLPCIHVDKSTATPSDIFSDKNNKLNNG